MIDVYCYEDCEVLRNKFGIKDSAKLDEAEVNFSCNAIHELFVSPLLGDYDFKHFCDFHRYIFGNIYDWAGEPRIVEMEKAEAVLGYMSIEYAKPDEIKKMATGVLERMNSRNWKNMSLDERVNNLSTDMADLWKVHSFREGNTRTTITFICQFADSKEMPMDRELFEKHSAYTRNALVAASAFFNDADFRQTEYLRKIIKDSLTKGLQNSRQQEQQISLDGWKSKIGQMKAEQEKTTHNGGRSKEKSER